MSGGRFGGPMRWGPVAAILEAGFLLLLLVADLQPGQPPWQATISSLVHGRAGWLVTTAFGLHAASLVALALHLRRTWLPLVMAAAGIIVVAVFPEGGSTGTVHQVGAWLAFGGLAAAALWEVRRRRGALRILSGAVAVATVLMAASLAWGLFPVFERLQVAINGAWVVAVALLPVPQGPAEGPAALG